jgi:D-arginine dehydrogenase
MADKYDFIVIGGGIMGVSIAAHLAQHASVRLLEMEGQAGFHATGRSAALFLQTYGNATVRALTQASRSFFYSPPPSFCPSPLVAQRSILITARTGQAETMETFIRSVSPCDEIVMITPARAAELLPVLKTDDLMSAVYSRSPADIQVHELLQGYFRLFKARQGSFSSNARVRGLERMQDGWKVTTDQESMQGVRIINAAGAWAGEIGKLAGAQDIRLRALKRTVCLIDPPAGASLASWPMLSDLQEQYYLKPEAGMLLLSPSDETATEPCDAQADELDVAIAVDRIQSATTIEVQRVAHKWAGLRSFVDDRSPVVGYDPIQSGFFWIAALGGFGIQTAPAVSQLAASLALARPVDEHILQTGLRLEALAPERLISADRPVGLPLSAPQGAVS